MSDQPSKGPEEQAAGSEHNEPKPSRSKGWFNLPSILIGGALGIAGSFFFIFKGVDLMPTILPVILKVLVAVLLIVIAAVLILPFVFNYLIKRYTGQAGDVETTVGDIQARANEIADTVAAYALAKANPEVRQNVRQDLPRILHYFVFSRVRGSGFRLLMTVFVAVGGLLGTILLFRQNELLQKQNEKIDNQILLEEASRRSSLNFLLGNVLDQVNDELKDPENTERRLSAELIGRIAALSQSLQPYYFIEKGKMTETPLSPERGNLLLNLINYNLDTLVLAAIYHKTTFQDAYLERANLQEVYLKRAQLKGAKLKGASLLGSNLQGANLINADLSEAELVVANLKGAFVRGTNFHSANLSFANLSLINVQDYFLQFVSSEFLEIRPPYDSMQAKIDFSFANLRSVDFNMADLSYADFDNSKNITREMLISSRSIYKAENLPDSIGATLKLEIAEKPNGW